jgi:hypothetical protein
MDNKEEVSLMELPTLVVTELITVPMIGDGIEATVTQHTALIKALINARKTFADIRKDAVNPFHKNKYATLDSVLDAVTPSLLNNGLYVSQHILVLNLFDTETVKKGHYLVTRLYHEDGGYLYNNYWLGEFFKAQDAGIAITYARRYSITALLGVTADSDDDGDADRIAHEKRENRKDEVKNTARTPVASGTRRRSVNTQTEEE